MTAQRIRQVDIARRVGVDKSTVSLALRDHPSISAETKARIVAVAQEMGYRRDALNDLLANLRWEKSGGKRQYANLALLRTRPGFLGRKCDVIFRGARRRAEELGVALDEMYLSEYPDLRSLHRVLQARGVRGILVAPGGHDIPWDALPWGDYAVVNADLGYSAPRAHTVMSDYFTALQMAWNHLRASGHRRIGFGLQAYLDNEIDARRVGAAHYLIEHCTPAEDRVPLLAHAYEDQASFLDWFRAHQPEAVIVSTPSPVDWLQAAGVRVPDDVAVVALERFFTPEGESDLASSVVERLEEIGRRAVDRVLLMFRDGERGLPEFPETIIVKPDWREGWTE